MLAMKSLKFGSIFRARTAVDWLFFFLIQPRQQISPSDLCSTFRRRTARQTLRSLNCNRKRDDCPVRFARQGARKYPRFACPITHSRKHNSKHRNFWKPKPSNINFISWDITCFQQLRLMSDKVLSILKG